MVEKDEVTPPGQPPRAADLDHDAASLNECGVMPFCRSSIE
jgi:hypothetical protein